MTVQKARKILGKRAKSLTDSQILGIINMLRFICNKAIDQAYIGKWIIGVVESVNSRRKAIRKQRRANKNNIIIRLSERIISKMSFIDIATF